MSQIVPSSAMTKTMFGLSAANVVAVMIKKTVVKDRITDAPRIVRQCEGRA
jgi:hypothetical protein